MCHRFSFLVIVSMLVIFIVNYRLILIFFDFQSIVPQNVRAKLANNAPRVNINAVKDDGDLDDDEFNLEGRTLLKPDDQLNLTETVRKIDYNLIK